MADATWEALNSEPNTNFYTATINSTDTQTEILEVSSDAHVTVQVSTGALEELTLKTSIHPVPATANMIDNVTEILTDMSVSSLGPVKGIQVSGAVTNASTIWVLERKYR